MFLANLGMGIPSFLLALLLILLFGADPALAADRGPAGRQAPGPARGRAGGREPRRDDAAHALVDARAARAGLHPHAAGQGPQAAADRLAARGPQRAHPDHLAHRLSVSAGCSATRSSSRRSSAGRVWLPARRLGDLERDYPVAQGLALLLTLTVLWANLLANIGHAIVDPRISEALSACRRLTSSSPSPTYPSAGLARRRRAAGIWRRLASTRSTLIGDADHARARRVGVVAPWIARRTTTPQQDLAELARAAVHPRAPARHRPARARHALADARTASGISMLRRLRHHRVSLVLRQGSWALIAGYFRGRIDTVISA